MGIIAIKVKDDFRPDNFGNAARVAVFLFLKVDVALLEVALAVEYDELDFLPETAAQSVLETRDLVFGICLGIAGEVIATLVEIYVEIVILVV